MVLLFLCSYLSSFAQLINLQLKNVTVKQAIETIQKQNGYSFAFAASDLNTKKIVTVLAKDLPIEKVVEQVLAGQDVSYTIQVFRLFMQLEIFVSGLGSLLSLA